MLNKKLMLLSIFFISLIAISAVNAEDVNNDTAVSCESQDLNDLSVDDIKTTDVSNDNIVNNDSAKVNCVQEENFLVVNVVDSDGKNITEGELTFISEDGDVYSVNLAGNNFGLFNLYYFEYDEFPQNITINFTNPDYSASTSIFCTLNNTIIAHDVFNESSFLTTFLGNDYLPAIGTTMGFIVDDGDMYYNEFIFFTDENAQILLDLALEPGNYTVIVNNMISGQRASFNWNVTQRDPTKESRINVTSDGYNIIFNLVDGLNNTVDDVYFDLYVNGTYYSHTSKPFNFYSLGEGTYEIGIYYDDFYYYPSNATVVVDVIDTIKVNDSFYNTTIIDALLFDNEGNPLNNGPFIFYCNSNPYAGVTDENGHAIVDLNLMPGIYEIKVVHGLSNQEKIVRLEVLEEYDYKRAFINVTQDKLRFIFNVTDFYGNLVDGGNVVVINDYVGQSIPINNGTAMYTYDEADGPYVEGEKNLIISLNNNNYYAFEFDYGFTFVNTIVSDDVMPGNVFNATFLDMDKTPIAGMEVLFQFSSHLDGRYEYLGNMTAVTDENGVASIEIDDIYFDWIVSFDNPVTGQIKRNIWINKELVEITPDFDYFDEVNGIYYVNGHVLVFKFSPSDATGEAYVDSEEYSYVTEVWDGLVKLWIPEFGQYDWTIMYYGDTMYNASIVYYSMIVCEMDLPTMTISENMVINHLDNANFTVNLVNGTNPIANASVEIIIGNNTYVMMTDDEGNINLPISVDAGKYDVSVNYNGSPSYVQVNKNTTLTVMEDSSLTVCDVVLDYDSLAYVAVATEGATGIVAKIGDVNATVVGNTIVISDLDAGNYTLSVTTIPDEAHYAVTKTANVTVNKVSTVLAASAVTTTYNVDKNLVITLKDYQNRPISGLQVSVVFDGSKKLTTDKNGQVKVSTHGVVPKTYSVSITFAGDDNYLKSTKSVKVTVKKATPKLTASAKTFKKSVKTKKYTITLKNNKNKIMKNAKVTLKVNGKTFTAKTNGKGKATFKITNLNKKGKFTAVVKYGGNKYYNAKTAKPKITVK